MDRDLAAVGNGIDRDAELRCADVLRAVGVERRRFLRGRQRPGRRLAEGAAGKLHVVQIREQIPAGRALRP